MPEIKHNFTAGKMNKDLDERLIPNGQYIDAMNIQVSTSGGSDVGAVQNILGNIKVSGQTALIPNNPICVGAIADESNDVLYWFIYGTDRDVILQLKNRVSVPGVGVITAVFIDANKNILKFNPNNIITGINVIDNMLFWTDGYYDAYGKLQGNEPKKLNIQRCIAGTNTTTTQLINASQDLGLGSSVDIKEEHITVIKKSPKTPPTIELVSERSNITGDIYTGVMRITEPFDTSIPSSNPSSFNLTGTQKRFDFSNIFIGEKITTRMETDINGDSGFTLDWNVGDTILLKEFDGDNPPSLPITDYTIKGKIYTSGWNNFTDIQSEKAPNGDFITPNSSGTKPDGYDAHSGSFGVEWVYDAINNKIACNTNTWSKLYNNGNPIVWTIDGDYKIRFKLSNVTAGGIQFYILADSQGAGNGYPYYWYTPLANSNDIHETTLKLSTATATQSHDYSFFTNKFFLQASGSGFVGDIEWISIVDLNVNDAMVAFEVLAIEGTPPVVESPATELKYAIDKQDEKEKLFEFKFPRFAYRYKYEDEEYSTFSPFSEIAFLPGSFDYHPKKGYNLGMTNRIKEVAVKNFTTNVPKDVVSIDILYKDDASPSVYVVDTLTPKDDITSGSNAWSSDEYVVDSEIISQVLPSNQLLRPWDNVPRRALAQDVTANRIVYGNYLQNYDLKSINTNNPPYYPDFDFTFINNNISNTTKSIKSLREYQLGIVFGDEYGRETPVISSPGGTEKLNKTEANKSNEISISFNNEYHVKDMKYFKFFVKETSGEYYNMAMDRFWDAGDGHAWVSFPSSDRNKIDLDTFLILKKGVETNTLITDPARYKVLAIENEAPDFIKTRKTLIEEKEHQFSISGKNIFNNNTTNAPLSGRDSFKMNYEPFHDSSGAELHKIEDVLYVEFTLTGEEGTSHRYRIAEISTDWDGTAAEVSDSVYNIKLDKFLGSDVDFIANSVSNPTKIIDSAIIKIYKYKVENSPEFDGRFFVKVINDDIFAEHVVSNVSTDPNYRVVTSKKLYSMLPIGSGVSTPGTHAYLHRSAVTGQTNGAYADAAPTNFGRFAPYFRNYPGMAGSVVSELQGGGVENVDQYLFGSGDDWKDEFLDLTSAGSTYWQNPIWGDYWSTNRVFDADTKKADEAAVDEAVWFIDGGSYVGHRGTDDDLEWQWISQVDSTNNGINRVGTNNYSYLNIAIGGIFNDEIAEDSNKHIGDFFSIGKDGGNTNYDNTATNLFVDQLNPGVNFRFREDPNANVYTIQPNVSPKRLLRYHDGSTAETAATEGNPLTEFPWTDATGIDQIAQLSPNFSRNWSLRIKNQNDTNTHLVSWDPTNGGTPGPINNGLVIGGISADATSVGDEASCVIKVDTLEGTFSLDGGDAKSKNIEPGLIITSYNNGAKTLDGTGGTNDTAAYKDWLIIKEITGAAAPYSLHLCGYKELLTSNHYIFVGANAPVVGEEIIFKQPAMNGYSQWSVNRINHFSGGPSVSQENPGVLAVGYTIEFLEPIKTEAELPSNPAIWETEPKESADLDIYYEASGSNPLEFNDDTKNIAVPIGSTVKHVGSKLIVDDVTITNVTSSGSITLSQQVPTGSGFIETGHELRITKPDGSSIDYTIKTLPTVGAPNTFVIETDLYSDKTTYNLNWFNCYSFGNGVESNRIRDNFNLPYISNGVRVSTTLEEGEYKEEERKYGLIYSGIYNSNSGINNLNQFIAAEKITKDVNPIYGSIQKLHSRDTDLITLCEDKVLKILANKDAVYNADGNINLTATTNVLGQTVPFVGEFGISKNPESFASESYRAYFTDKQRGAVLRLSQDGLTPISDHGMRDWFRDKLKLGNKYLLGSYDDKKDDYNLTIKGDINTLEIGKTVTFNEKVRGWVSFKSFVPENAISMANDYYTMKDGKLWKHHDESVNRNTFYGAGAFTESSIKFVLNDSSGVVKTFNTLNYEGSQSKIDEFVSETHGIITYDTDHQYYNLSSKKGWYANNIQTDLQNGSIPEFIKKEGKWFNYIKGKEISINASGDISSEEDSAEFSFQGIGVLTSLATTVVLGCMDSTMFNYNPAATANDPNNPCIPKIFGCMDSTNPAYNSAAIIDTTPTSCIYLGCMDSSMKNYNSNANTPSTCIPFIYGCTDNTMFNYDSLANSMCDSNYSGCTSVPNSNIYNVAACTGPKINGNCCESPVDGCTNAAACNYNSAANTNDGSCIMFTSFGPTFSALCPGSFSLAPLLLWYNSLIFKQTAPIGYEHTQTCDITDPNGLVTSFAFGWDGTLITSSATNPIPPNSSPPIVQIAVQNQNLINGSYTVSWNLDFTDPCINDCGGSLSYNVILGCIDSSSANYDSTANIDDGSCIAYVYGCMDCGYLWEAVQARNNPGSTDPTILYCNGVSAAATNNPGSCNFDPLATGQCDNNNVGCTTTSTPPCTGPKINGGCCDSNACTDPIAENYGECGNCVYIQGCTVQAANNYNSTATQDNGSCMYDGCKDSTIGSNPYWNILLSTYSLCSNGVLCMTINCCGAGNGYAASNYNSSANITHVVDECVYPGCNDSTALNYNSLATVLAPNSCIYPTYGCMDSTACNYDSTATNSSGSCDTKGCMDSLATNYDSTAVCEPDPSTCTYVVASPTPGIWISTLTPLGSYPATSAASLNFSSSPVFNSIIVAWLHKDQSGNPIDPLNDGYKLRYKPTGTSTWRYINITSAMANDTANQFFLATEGTYYLHELPGGLSTGTAVAGANPVTNLWPSGTSDPPEYDITVRQVYDATLLAGVPSGNISVPYATPIQYTNFAPNDGSVGSGKFHLNFTVELMNTTVIAGVGKKYELKYTWDPFEIPPTYQGSYGAGEFKFTIKTQPFPWQVTGYTTTTQRLILTSSTIQGNLKDNNEKNTNTRFVTVPWELINVSGVSVNSFVISANLKIGEYNHPIDGTGCHKPGPAPGLSLHGNNTNDLFFCPPISTSEEVLITLNI